MKFTRLLFTALSTLALTFPLSAHPFVNQEMVFNQVTPESKHFPIARAKADGSEVVRLTDPNSIDLDPSWMGQRILFAHFDSKKVLWQLCTMDRDGKDRKVVCNVTDAKKIEVTRPLASPSGEWIVFAETEFGNPRRGHQLYLVRSDGTRLHPVGPERSFYPVWAPDSKAIWFRRIMNTAPTRPGEGATISINSMDFEGRNVKTYAAAETIGGFSLSPDGTKVLYDGSSSGMDWHSNFYTVTPGSEPVATGPRGHNINVNPQWISADRMILTRRRGSDDWSIYSAKLDGTDFKELVHGALLGGEMVDWSTDLHSMIYGKLVP